VVSSGAPERRGSWEEGGGDEAVWDESAGVDEVSSGETELAVGKVDGMAMVARVGEVWEEEESRRRFELFDFAISLRPSWCLRSLSLSSPVHTLNTISRFSRLMGLVSTSFPI
jgi:hypothetical protein